MRGFSITVFWQLLTIHIISGEENSEFCNIESDYCPAVSGNKYLFYDVNPPEGFNLRRDVYMRFAIMLVEARKTKPNWNLVLPPWFRLYHWKTSFNSEPNPWSTFFDTASLKSYAPVIELYEVFDIFKYKLAIDTLYVLQNYPFDGNFEDKWEISDQKCEYTGFWGYKNITAKNIICIKFQGKISKLWDLIDLYPNDRKVMIAHGEIPLHDSYGSIDYWRCRKSMKFNKELIKIARDFIMKKFNCSEQLCKNYLALHWRRQDFISTGRVPSIKGTAAQINESIKKHVPEIKNIFIATDATPYEITELKDKLNNLGYNVFNFESDDNILNKYKDAGVAIIEQIICSHADYFVGSHESTFTYRIQEEREILGFNSDTTFNRLCPEDGVCEKPSRWLIVN